MPQSPWAQDLQTEKVEKIKNKRKYGHPYLPWYMNHFIPLAKLFPSKRNYKPVTLRWIMSNDDICLVLNSSADQTNQPVFSGLCIPSLCWWLGDKERERREFLPKMLLKTAQSSEVYWSLLVNHSSYCKANWVPVLSGYIIHTIQWLTIKKWFDFSEFPSVSEASLANTLLLALFSPRSHGNHGYIQHCGLIIYTKLLLHNLSVVPRRTVVWGQRWWMSCNH